MQAYALYKETQGLPDRVVKQEDVAKLAGVSPSTVSRILLAKEGQKIPYSPQTQAKVREAAAILGYRPSMLARGLARRRSGIVGLVVPWIKDVYFPSVLALIQSQLSSNGYKVILVNTEGSTSVEKEEIEDLLSWRVNGLVIAPAQETTDASIFWSLWERKIPFVLLDRFFAGAPFFSVTHDDFTGAYLATEHLIATGRKRIACAAWHPNISTSVQRQAGYIKALLRNGLEPDPDLVIEVPLSVDGGRQAVRIILSSGSRPDALFCFSDLVAMGAMEECIKVGIRIPDDLALVGFGDHDHSRMLRIPLTTVRQPREPLADQVVETLLSVMNGTASPEVQKKIEMELMVRDSTSTH